jgi:hypothetical protein
MGLFRKRVDIYDAIDEARERTTGEWCGKKLVLG